METNFHSHWSVQAVVFREKKQAWKVAVNRIQVCQISGTLSFPSEACLITSWEVSFQTDSPATQVRAVGEEVFFWHVHMFAVSCPRSHVHWAFPLLQMPVAFLLHRCCSSGRKPHPVWSCVVWRNPNTKQFWNFLPSARNFCPLTKSHEMLVLICYIHFPTWLCYTFMSAVTHWCPLKTFSRPIWTVSYMSGNSRTPSFGQVPPSLSVGVLAFMQGGWVSFHSKNVFETSDCAIGLWGLLVKKSWFLSPCSNTPVLPCFCDRLVLFIHCLCCLSLFPKGLVGWWPKFFSGTKRSYWGRVPSGLQVEISVGVDKFPGRGCK